MNSYAQDFLALSTKAGTTAEVGAALQRIAQVISARSPHVEMWRTTSWTYCNLLMNEAYEEARAYLQAGELAMAVPVHNAVDPKPAATFDDPLLLKELVDHVKTTADRKEKITTLELEIAKLKCEKITDEKAQAADANCVKVKEAETAAKKST